MTGSPSAAFDDMMQRLSASRTGQFAQPAMPSMLPQAPVPGMQSSGGAPQMGPVTTYGAPSAPASNGDTREKWRAGLQGIGQFMDQLGSSFDQRHSQVIVPNRPIANWQPNVNPGIAGLVQQLLLAQRMR